MRALPSGTGKILLSWSDVTPDEIGFLVERREGFAGAWQRIADENDLPADTTLWIDDDPLLDKERYSYRVASRHGSGDSAWSTISSAVPPYIGPPFVGWIDVVADAYVTNPADAASTTAGIQAALAALGGAQGRGPHARHDAGSARAVLPRQRLPDRRYAESPGTNWRPN